MNTTVKEALKRQGTQELLRFCQECHIDMGAVLQKKYVVLTGPKGSGKDTAGALPLLDDCPHLFERVPMAGAYNGGGIKEVCQHMFGLTEAEMEDAVLKEKSLNRWPWVAPRKLLQDEANYLRDKYTPDIHVRGWLRRVAASEKRGIVVTDLRFPEELRIFLALDALILWMDREVAQKRLEEQIAAQDTLATNVSESHWDLIRSCVSTTIDNNSTLYDAYEHVRKAVAQYM